MDMWERRPIDWSVFQVETGKGLCLFCNTVATHMRKKAGTSHWQALCDEHKDSTKETK